jgi:hypothetical protein
MDGQGNAMTGKWFDIAGIRCDPEVLMSVHFSVVVIR